MSSERRQSGLWARNLETGVYENLSNIPRAQIAGNFIHEPHISAAATAAGAGQSPYGYLAHPYHRRPPPPGATSHQPAKRSFSARSAQASQADDGHSASTSNHGRRQQPDRKPREAVPHVPPPAPEAEAVRGQPQLPSWTIDADDAPTTHPSPTTPGSPDLLSSLSTHAFDEAMQAHASGNAADRIRRASVPDRSPLQDLELRSKEAKRARVQAAEERARQQAAARQRGGETAWDSGARKGRVVSDSAAQTPSQRDQQRNPSLAPPDDGAARFHQARDALMGEDRSEWHSPTSTHSVPVANQAKVYDRASAAPRQPAANETLRRSREVERSGSRKYRARDAGFASGAAAAWTGPTFSGKSDVPESGSDRYSRRRGPLHADAPSSPVSPISPARDRAASGVGRSQSQRQHHIPPSAGAHGTHIVAIPKNRVLHHPGPSQEREMSPAPRQPDPVPRASVDIPTHEGPRYTIPPQSANAKRAKEQVAFAETIPVQVQEPRPHHRFGGILRRNHEHRGYQPSAPLEEWRSAQPAILTADDLDFEQPATGPGREGRDNPWWERSSRQSSASSSKPIPDLQQNDGLYEEQANGFQPRLFLKCGPLLRYTGIRKQTVRNTRTQAVTEREVWKGTVMIVTEDDQSDLSSPPMLRLFAQNMDLYAPPPTHVLDSGLALSPEYEDPVAGQVKLSRTGRALYVRPVHDIDGSIDLSREENNQGLFSALRTPVLGPQGSIGKDGRSSTHITFQNKSRIKKRDGEKANRYRETRAVRLHTDRGFTFWRFSVEIELASRQTRVAYRINRGPAIGFWVPARGQTMNIMFHSCNGFSLAVDSHTFSGPDPLWRDVLNRHQARPFHVMIGGGDQIYNDAVTRDTELFRDWLHTKNPQHKHEADFSVGMQDELEAFYLHRYAMWFSQGLFSMANSQIPMVNIWDDHDIIDGYGSYPHHFMSTGVFTGLGAIAYKYYMLFQHQSVASETEVEESSWLLGPSPGPYIHERSRNLFMSLGRHVAFLGLDCRTERMRDEILSQQTYDAIFERCRAEIVRGETRHLIVLLGVPIAYPRLNFLENILTSRVMDPIKAIGRTGVLGGFVNKFDGGVEILDDLDDHWTAKHHKAERNWFIQELQELAAEKSVRITILGGDVHLGAVGQFFSNRRLGLGKDRDHRYMPNVISSAIVNTPPPSIMADVLNKRNKMHHLDAETDEDMIPMFSHDVDGSRRNNHHLLPRRNFCIINEYVPGHTPPPTPRPDLEAHPADAPVPDKASDRRFPPSSMKRTMSLTRGPVSLVRRLSGSSKKSFPPLSLQPQQTRPVNEGDRRANSMQRSNSLSAVEGSNYGPGGAPMGAARPQFHRRPTSFSEKEARYVATARVNEGNSTSDREPGHIDLQGGLDISICMELDQYSPVGKTVPYRLLVPALWYEGSGDINLVRFSSHRKGLLEKLRRNRKREAHLDGNLDDQRSVTEGSRTPSPPPRPDRFDERTERNTAANARPNFAADVTPAATLGLISTGRGAMRPPNHDHHGHRHDSVHASTQGYPLSGPPIGSLRPLPSRSISGPQSDRSVGLDYSYPPSGYRRTSAPPSWVPQRPPYTVQQPPAPPRGPYGRSPSGEDDDDAGEYVSATPLASSEDYAGEPTQRNGVSKAGRIFGTAVNGARKRQEDTTHEEGPEGAGLDRGKKGWRIWK